VFDLFSVWRMDSGSYEAMVSHPAVMPRLGICHRDASQGGSVSCEAAWCVSAQVSICSPCFGLASGGRKGMQLLPFSCRMPHSFCRFNTVPCW
jgi:hypothetical protein